MSRRWHAAFPPEDVAGRLDRVALSDNLHVLLKGEPLTVDVAAEQIAWRAL